MRFPARARGEAEELLRVFPPFRAAASRWLGVEPAGRPVLTLVRDHREMADRGGAGAPEWAVAIARRDDRLFFRLDLLGGTPGTSVPHVAAHESVHQVLAHLGGFPLPRWFEEGLCVHFAGVAYFEPDTRLERLAAAGNLPTFAEAGDLFAGDGRKASIGYRFGQEVVAAFLSRFGEEALKYLLREVAEGRRFEHAFLAATGVPLALFEREWRARITPSLPFWLFLLLENLELALLCAGALAVALGYLRYRLRREAALARLDRMP